MRGSQHLQINRYGVYCFRYTFPKAFVEAHPSQPKTILLSLKTRNKLLAVRRVQQLWLRTNQLMVEVGGLKGGPELSEPSIASVLSAFRNHIAGAEPHEQNAVYWGQPQFRAVLGGVEEQLLLISEHGFLPFLNTDDFSNLGELYQRSSDVQSRVIEGQLDQLGDVAVGAVLQSPSEIHSMPLPVPTISTAEENKDGVKLSSLLDLFLASNLDGELKASASVTQVASRFRVLIEAVDDKRVADFNKEDVGIFLALLDVRTRRLQGENVKLSATTKNEYIAACKRVFEFAKARMSDVAENLFAASSLRYRKNGAVGESAGSRIPFTKNELKNLFSQPTHTDCKFDYPFEYWMPLLALYTGARQNELCQLHLDDVYLDYTAEDGTEVWCISHNLKTKDKRLKTKKARVVPLHPKLLELGFIEFVKLLSKRNYSWKDKNGYQRIFDGLSFVGKGYGKNCSRWFNGTEADRKKGKLGFKQAVGIGQKDGVMKDFHSFRHTCSTALENLDVMMHVSFRITGHTSDQSIADMYGSAGGKYRQGLEVRTMYEAICKLDFEEQLSAVRPFFDVCKKKRLRRKVKSKK